MSTVYVEFISINVGNHSDNKFNKIACEGQYIYTLSKSVYRDLNALLFYCGRYRVFFLYMLEEMPIVSEQMENSNQVTTCVQGRLGRSNKDCHLNKGVLSQGAF